MIARLLTALLLIANLLVAGGSFSLTARCAEPSVSTVAMHCSASCGCCQSKKSTDVPMLDDGATKGPLCCGILPGEPARAPRQLPALLPAGNSDLAAATTLKLLAVSLSFHALLWSSSATDAADLLKTDAPSTDNGRARLPAPRVRTGILLI